METKIFKYNSVTFTLSGTDIFVETALQRFRLVPEYHYYRVRCKFIGRMIQMGEIQNLNDLCEECSTHIALVPTYIQPKVPEYYGN